MELADIAKIGSKYAARTAIKNGVMSMELAKNISDAYAKIVKIPKRKLDDPVDDSLKVVKIETQFGARKAIRSKQISLETA